MEAEIKKSGQGFAALDPERRREIASMGGKASHAKGTANKFSREEAIIAGRKGGLASKGKRRRRDEG